MISARYPTIQFNSDTVYLELVPDSIDLRPQSHKVPWSQVPHTHTYLYPNHKFQFVTCTSDLLAINKVPMTPSLGSRVC